MGGDGGRQLQRGNWETLRLPLHGARMPRPQCRANHSLPSSHLLPLHCCSLPAGPLAKIYFGSQFAPLIIFFVMFLSIVKNNKLHHFVRFNCMQVGGCAEWAALSGWAGGCAALGGGAGWGCWACKVFCFCIGGLVAAMAAVCCSVLAGVNAVLLILCFHTSSRAHPPRHNTCPCCPLSPLPPFWPRPSRLTLHHAAPPQHPPLLPPPPALSKLKTTHLPPAAPLPPSPAAGHYA